MFDAKINAISGNADLRMDFTPDGFQFFFHPYFKIAVRYFFNVTLTFINYALSGIGQKAP